MIGAKADQVEHADDLENQQMSLLFNVRPQQGTMLHDGRKHKVGVCINGYECVGQ